MCVPPLGKWLHLRPNLALWMVESPMLSHVKSFWVTYRPGLWLQLLHVFSISSQSWLLNIPGLTQDCITPSTCSKWPGAVPTVKPWCCQHPAKSMLNSMGNAGMFLKLWDSERRSRVWSFWTHPYGVPTFFPVQVAVRDWSSIPLLVDLVAILL